MNTNASFFVFVVGLLLTLGGIGGVENSVDSGNLVGSFAVCCVGLCIMYCGTTALNVSDYYDKG